jgi:sorting nexin-29
LGNYQCGFRKGKSTVDQIHSLRQILEKTREYNISTFHLFIDFKAAYDSVKRDKLLMAMEEFLIPQKLINLTKATLRNIKCRVKIQNQLFALFITERGLRQGDTLACLLFNIALEWAIKKSGIETRDNIS